MARNTGGTAKGGVRAPVLKGRQKQKLKQNLTFNVGAEAVTKFAEQLEQRFAEQQQLFRDSVVDAHLYLVGKALPAAMSTFSPIGSDGTFTPEQVVCIVKRAFEVADGVMAERSKRKGVEDEVRAAIAGALANALGGAPERPEAPKLENK